MRLRTGVAACGRVGIPSIIFASSAAFAATPILSMNEFNSTVNGSTSTASPHTQGNATVTATTNALALSNIGGNLTYTGANQQITASKSTGGNTNTFDSTNVQRVQFSLGLNESASVALTGGYSLTEAALAGSSLAWSLTGPGNITLFSGGTTTAGSGSINHLLPTVTGQGTYTLVFTGLVNGSTTTNSANLASATFSSINFSVTAIPEPSTALLAGTICMGVLLRRRRSI